MFISYYFEKKLWKVSFNNEIEKNLKIQDNIHNIFKEMLEGVNSLIFNGTLSVRTKFLLGKF